MGTDMKAICGPLSLEDEGEGQSKLNLGLGDGTPYIEEYYQSGKGAVFSVELLRSVLAL